jgi:hypothetical protein
MDIDPTRTTMQFNAIDKLAGLPETMPIQQAPEALLAINDTVAVTNYALTEAMCDEAQLSRREAFELQKRIEGLRETAAKLTSLVRPVGMTLEDELQQFIFKQR